MDEKNTSCLLINPSFIGAGYPADHALMVDLEPFFALQILGAGQHRKLCLRRKVTNGKSIGFADNSAGPAAL
jgi:hypothetical protein